MTIPTNGTEAAASPVEPTVGHDPSIHVTFVTSEGCRFCSQAAALLEELERRYPLEIEEIALHTARGADIVRQWRVPFPPVVLIDDEYHGHGRISARKLTRDLERRLTRGD